MKIQRNTDNGVYYYIDAESDLESRFIEKLLRKYSKKVEKTGEKPLYFGIGIQELFLYIEEDMEKLYRIEESNSDIGQLIKDLKGGK